jgi:hypothetical protein
MAKGKELYCNFMAYYLVEVKSNNQINPTMKKQSFRFVSRILASAFIAIVLTVSVFAYPSGSPAVYTGSPGDGQHCVSCHGGSAATVSGWITSNIPATGYVAGTSYAMTVTVSGSGKKGFEVSPQNVAGLQLGVLAPGTGNKLVGGTKYVTQTSSGSTSSTVIWNFTWTAPAAGTGTVTFYGAFTVGKLITKLSTLEVNEDFVLPLSATSSATPSLVCAGQSAQLNVVAAGGSGTYTYSWTSVPAGFISALQNPVVTPSVSTQYFASVSDGTLYAEASTSVTVNQPATSAAGNDTTCAYIVTQVPLSGSATNYSSVLWSTSGTGTFSAASALTGSYLPSEADKSGGMVTLTLTAEAQSPCTAQVADFRVIHFDAPIGMEEVRNTETTMTVSPNPSNGYFRIKVAGLDSRDAAVTILDITGKTIVQRAIPASGNGQEQFDLSGFPKGIYLVRMKTSNATVIKKLVVE